MDEKEWQNVESGNGWTMWWRKGEWGIEYWDVTSDDPEGNPVPPWGPGMDARAMALYIFAVQQDKAAGRL